MRAFGLKGLARSPCLTIASVAEAGEADEHHRPGRGLGGGRELRAAAQLDRSARDGAIMPIDLCQLEVRGRPSFH